MSICTGQFPTNGPCPLGFTGANGDCSDIDECSLHSGRCAQACVNVEGSFYCSCVEEIFGYPYYITEDLVSCSIVPSFWKHLSFVSSATLLLLTVVGIAVDIYWATILQALTKCVSWCHGCTGSHQPHPDRVEVGRPPRSSSTCLSTCLGASISPPSDSSTTSTLSPTSPPQASGKILSSSSLTARKSFSEKGRNGPTLESDRHLSFVLCSSTSLPNITASTLAPRPCPHLPSDTSPCHHSPSDTSPCSAVSPCSPMSPPTRMSDVRILPPDYNYGRKGMGRSSVVTIKSRAQVYEIPNREQLSSLSESSDSQYQENWHRKY